MTWAEGFTREKQVLFEELLLDWEDAPYNQEKALESFLEHVRAFLDPSDGKTAVDKQGKK